MVVNICNNILTKLYSPLKYINKTVNRDIFKFSKKENANNDEIISSNIEHIENINKYFLLLASYLDIINKLENQDSQGKGQDITMNNN